MRICAPRREGRLGSGSAPLRRQPPDEGLRALVRKVDSDRLRATVERLTEFGTRHTLSSQTDPVCGIGAATNWVMDQLQTIAAASGGRMTVQRQSLVQPARSRGFTVRRSLRSR